MTRSPLALAASVALGVLPFAVVFVGSLYHPIDPDLGWHLRYGQYWIAQHHVLRENVLSTTMTGYRWVNPSWGTDVLTYVAFRWGAFAGLVLLSGLTATVGFALITRAAEAGPWETALLAPVFLALQGPLLVGSFRPQLLTLPLLGGLLLLLRRFESGRRPALILTIPLFLAWANLHGHFVLGLGVFGIWALAYGVARAWSSGTLRDPRGGDLALALLLAAAVTLVNPYGIQAHLEAARHLGEPVTGFIAEWTPFPRASPWWWLLAAWAGVLGAAALGARGQPRARTVADLAVAAVLLALSFRARRFAWPMFLASLVVMTPLLARLKPARAVAAKGVAAIVLAVSYLWLVERELPRREVRGMSWSSYCRIVRCSPPSAEFLSRASLPGRLLSFYDWGGWLIWCHPRVKPSVDGRMTLWRDESGYSSFEEYYGYEVGWRDVDASEYDVVYVPPFKPIFARMVDLVRRGRWAVAYSDPLATVFVRAAPREAPAAP